MGAICAKCLYCPCSEQRAKDFVNGREWLCEKDEWGMDFVTGNPFIKTYLCREKNKEGKCPDYMMRS